MPSHIVKQIQERLEQQCTPSFLRVIDDSARHAGHAGAKETGGGHYTILIASHAFQGQSLVRRHQMIYQAVQPLLKEAIHALMIKALTSEEWQASGQKILAQFDNQDTIQFNDQH